MFESAIKHGIPSLSRHIMYAATVMRHTENET